MNLNPFKNKAVQFTVVDKPVDYYDPNTEIVSTNPEEIAQIITESAVKILGVAGAVVVAHKLISTACDIAVIAAKAKL